MGDLIKRVVNSPKGFSTKVGDKRVTVAKGEVVEVTAKQAEAFKDVLVDPNVLKAQADAAAAVAAAASKPAAK